MPLGDPHRGLGVLAAGAVAREHIEQHEVGDCRRRLLADRALPARGQRPLGNVAEHRALGIGGPDRIAVIGIQTVREVALGGFDPFVELIRLQHERHQRLASLRIFRVGHRQDGIHQMQFSRLADRTDRHVGVVHVLGDVLLARVVVRCDVDRDAVVGPVDLVTEERLVVERVVP